MGISVNSWLKRFFVDSVVAKGECMAKIKLGRSEYRDKVYACWMGKNIGGTLGAPFECRKWVNCLEYYHKTPDEAAANDDLDLQLVWLKMLEDKGVDPALSDFADYWKKCASPYPWNEYGFCNRNFARGLRPPVSGCFENHYIDEMGSPIRSEIWACAAPGDPQLAASFAWKDSSVDHAGGEGTYGEMFWAAVESAAFVINDPKTLIHIGLQMIPIHCRISRVIREAVWCHENGISWAEARQRILEAFGRDYNPCNAVQNHGFTILGWLYGKDFGDKLCIAVNCAYDTDCTGATLGSVLGILDGVKGIPEKWTKPIGEKIVLHKFTQVPGAPKTISELTERTVKIAEKFLKARSEAAEFSPGKTVKPKDPVSVLCSNEMATQALMQDPMSAVERRDGIDIWFHYGGEPVVRPGISKNVGMHLEKDGKPVDGSISIIVPRNWTVNRASDNFGQKRFALFADKASDRNEMRVKVNTGSKKIEASFMMLGPGEAKGYPVNAQAGNCPKCGGWPGSCLCAK